jgi:hypothetical protein
MTAMLPFAVTETTIGAMDKPVQTGLSGGSFFGNG